MEVEWWQNNLKQLESTDKRLQALTDMYNKINKTAALPRQIIESLLCAPALYECVQLEDVKADKEPTATLATDLIRTSLNQLELDTGDARLPEILKLTLCHQNSALRALGFDKLAKELSAKTNLQPLPTNELILYVLEELGRTETQSSTAATVILAVELPQWLTYPGVQQKLVQLLQKSDVVRCRVYELAVILAKHSAANLSSMAFLLDAALVELDNDDVLLQSCILEIFIPLAEQNHGLDFLERRQVFDIISTRVLQLDTNPLHMLLVPSIMKFFGKIAAMQPQKIIAGHPHMVLCLFEQIQLGDQITLPTAMDTLANVASTVSGKMLIHEKFQPSMELILDKYADYVVNLTPPLKIRLLNCLDMIYTLEKPPTDELNIILKNWYERFAVGQQMDHLMGLLSTPFPDLQIAALGLLKTLCKFDWGLKAVQLTAGAVEFLLSRQQDLHTDVMYLKWQIMQLLATSSVFSTQDILRFNAYISDGPYKAQSEAHVSTERQGS